ncbi:MAG: hypothetical protein M0R48_07040 [Candidatus Omnitrophica bacterium]|jgi:Skp family chaperone for outer membrane proteins|nr:hypothetical protein [Candidatus Omnitrophota bacterium]
MIRNIVTLFAAGVFVVFFSSICLCQDNVNTPVSNSSSITDKGADKDTVGGKTEEKKVKTDEEIKKEKEKAEEKKEEKKEKKKEEMEEETEEENPSASEETLDAWDDSTPAGSDLDSDGSINIWKDDQGFIDR